jgi:hypothetical protein
MRNWKKLLIGGIAAGTVIGGANFAAMAAGSDDAPARVQVQVRPSSQHSGDIRQEDRRQDRAGDVPQEDRREPEAERHGANENEVRHEAEAERHGADEKGDDRSGRSDDSSARSDGSGRSDDSGHHGSDA